MSLTKPAGVACQILGIFIVLLAFGSFGNNSYISGFIFLALGVWLFGSGGKPARK